MDEGVITIDFLEDHLQVALNFTRVVSDFAYFKPEIDSYLLTKILNENCIPNFNLHIGIFNMQIILRFLWYRFRFQLLHHLPLNCLIREGYLLYFVVSAYNSSSSPLVCRWVNYKIRLWPVSSSFLRVPYSFIAPRGHREISDHSKRI